MNNLAKFSVQSPVKVGIVGTGFTAKLRAEMLQSDPRSRLVTVAGYRPESITSFSEKFQIEQSVSWRKLIEREDLDLIIVATVNRDHGTITRAALENGKHVVVEYPLSLDVSEGEEILALAQQNNKLLHVEHIELLGGLHQAIKEYLPMIGKVFYARYVTINPQYPVPKKWTYQPSLFGFPFMGALSRLHRFTDLFGEVINVSGHSQFWQTEPDFYQGCLCKAELHFAKGILAEAVYGKGENFWQSENTFTLYGEEGTLIFTPEGGQLIQRENHQNIEVGTRRGLFAKDTGMVLDCLINGTPLYVNAADSLYTLKVANAVKKSAEIGQAIGIIN